MIFGTERKRLISETNDVNYECIILSALERSLQTVGSDTDIRTCEDFGFFDARCCESCHGIYQHYEMSLVEIEPIGSAWICCALDRSLNSARYANLCQLLQHMTFNELLTAFLRRSEDA